MVDRVTRRSLLRSSAAAALGVGGIGVTSASGDGPASSSTEPADFAPIPTRDVSDAEFETVSSVPESADGIRTATQIFMHGDGNELSDFGIDRPGGCSANFIWRATGADEGKLPDAVDVDLPDQAEGRPGDDGGTLFLGAAGHCFLPDGADATEEAANPGEEGADVSDLRVTASVDDTFGGATTVFGLNGWGREAGTGEVYDVVELGEVVYARQTDPNGSSGVGHDFGIVKIPEELYDEVDPSMPTWGGPDGVTDEHVPEGEPIHQYGSGVGNGEVFATKGSTGVANGGTENAWYAGIRASPGDSGSPIVASDPGAAPETGGAAAGVVTHLTTAPPGTAGTTIGRCKEMVEQDIGLEIEVVQPGDL